MTDNTDDFLFAQHVGLNSPDFIFAFWGSVAWVPLISFYFSEVQPHLGAPQGDVLSNFTFCGCTVKQGRLSRLESRSLHDPIIFF